MIKLTKDMKEKNIPEVKLSDSTPKIKKHKKNLFVLSLITVVILGGIGSSIFFYTKYNALKNNPNMEAEKEVSALIAEVSKIMELPTDETPTIATISDKEKLSDQQFFAKAENGDKLLAYSGASMKAILYRPSTGKIINVAPIVMDGSEKEAPQQPVIQNNTAETDTDSEE